MPLSFFLKMCQGFDHKLEKFWQLARSKCFRMFTSAPAGSCKALPSLGKLKKLRFCTPLWFPAHRNCSVTLARLSWHFPFWLEWPSHGVSCAHGDRPHKQEMLWHLGLHLDLGLHRGLLKPIAALCFQDYIWMGEKIFLFVHLYVIWITLI